LAGPFFVRPNIFSPKPALPTDAVARQRSGAGTSTRPGIGQDQLEIARALNLSDVDGTSSSRRATWGCGGVSLPGLALDHVRGVSKIVAPVPPGTETEHAARYFHLIDT
jgi:hypothetical protein